MILSGGSSRYPVRDGVYVARKFCGCPACASSTDVSVRKCHETLRGIGLLESQLETPIAWRNTSITLARDIRILVTKIKLFLIQCLRDV